jgi:hypothetical protein
MGDALTFVSICLFCRYVWRVTLERITKARENDCTTHGDSCGTVPAAAARTCAVSPSAVDSMRTVAIRSFHSPVSTSLSLSGATRAARRC